VKQGRAEAIALAKTVSRLVVAKGKKIVDVDLKKERPSDDELAALMLGPTGNLRAPTVRKGKTLYVGFSEEAYRELTA
jgi:arsenate reductase-like glutaredoxin family protein